MPVIAYGPVGRGLYGQPQSRWRVFVSEVVSIVLRKPMSAWLGGPLNQLMFLDLYGKDVGFVTS